MKDIDLWADLADAVIVLARVAQRRSDEDDEIVRLTLSEGAVVRHLDGNPGATASEIAEATGLLKSNLSPMIRSLVERGMLERRPDPHDGRGSLLFLTPFADENLARVRQLWGRRLSESVAVEPAELRATVALLERIGEDLGTPSRRGSGR